MIRVIAWVVAKNNWFSCLVKTNQMERIVFHSLDIQHGLVLNCNVMYIHINAIDHESVKLPYASMLKKWPWI